MTGRRLQESANKMLEDSGIPAAGYRSENEERALERIREFLRYSSGMDYGKQEDLRAVIKEFDAARQDIRIIYGGGKERGNTYFQPSENSGAS